MTTAFNSSKALTVLSRLLLPPTRDVSPAQAVDPELIAKMSREEFDEMLTLANSHHVVIRALEVFLQIMCNLGDDTRAEWAATAIAAESERIRNATSFLQSICAAFTQAGYDVTVIKSLDHWPDLGSDLDLYTNTDSARVIALMREGFKASTAARSWGDRLAHKWNFSIPGLPELVEIHMGRLGQTGEQVEIANSIARRSRVITVGDREFRVAGAVDRLMISTLQRMYRHFYFRLCDIVDSAELSESGLLDYDDLRFSAKAAGIWKGVATYLVIVSDYVEHYRGEGLDLPSFVRDSSRFGGDQLHFARGFLRIPIMPQSAKLYGAQLTTLLRNRKLKNSVRLSLLPCLATAAVVGQKITGSDKGIW
jgi:hypothetical protein